MRLQEDKSHSAFSGGCFYAAFYLCLGAVVLFGYQMLLWFRHGAWVPHQMWLVLIWSGWERPPSIALGYGQPAIDRIWSLIGNCPITIVLCVLALVAALIGFAFDPSRTRPAAVGDAHSPP